MQLVMKLSITQKKPKFLVVKEELTKQIKSMGISKFFHKLDMNALYVFIQKPHLG